MTLIWNPLIRAVTQQCVENDSLAGVIAPFCQWNALQTLVEVGGQPDYVIVSWRLADLASGIGDLCIFEHLESLDVPLYIHATLHAKIYSFTSGSALCGSANTTARGLGISNEQNIECAVFVDLDLEDEISLRRLRDNALRVTPDVYLRFKEALAALDEPFEVPDGLDVELYRNDDDHQYLISSLPATKTPQDFISTCNHLQANHHSAEAIQAEIHDICTFDLDISMGGEQLEAEIASAFTAQPFVQDICQRIRSEGSMRFGAVTAFIQSTCRDVPMPFRRDIKETVNTLYNWLCYYFDDLEWDTPGARSQVIYSNRSRS